MDTSKNKYGSKESLDGSVFTNDHPIKESKDSPSSVSSPKSESFGHKDVSRNTTDNDCCLRIGCALPETDFHENIAIKPDLSKYCYKCGQFVPFVVLNAHQKYHKALKVLCYKNNEHVENYEQLHQKRQQALVTLASEDNHLQMQKFAQIDEAFDLLKGELDCLRTGSYVDYSVNCNVRGIGLYSSMEVGIQSIGLCDHENTKWKKMKEGSWAYRDSFGGDKNQCYFAIFDGYNGLHAAEVAANELHKALQREIVKMNTTLHCETLPPVNVASLSCVLDFHKTRQLYLRYIKQNECDSESTESDPNNVNVSSHDKNTINNNNNVAETSLTEKRANQLNVVILPEIKQAFKVAYSVTDTLLLHYSKNEHSRVRWSGCSALTCVFQAVASSTTNNVQHIGTNDTSRRTVGWLHLANAGNVRAVLVSNEKPHRLSKAHVPWNMKERNRIYKAGGRITGENKRSKVNSILETTRGLGNHGDPDLKSCISTDPFVTTVAVDETAQALIIATNGVWEVLNDQDAADIVLQCLPSREALQSKHAISSSSVQDLLVCKPHTHRLSPMETTAEVATEQLLSTGSNQENINMLEENQTLSDEHLSHSSVHSLELKVTKEQWETESIQDGMQTELGSGCDHEHELDHMSEVEELRSHSNTDGIVPNLSQYESTADRPPSANTESESDVTRLARSMAERLVQAALLAGSRSNAIAMVVLFTGGNDVPICSSR